MEFLTFLSSYFTGLSLSDPKVIALGLVLALMAVTRHWLVVFMVLGTVVAGQAIEFFVPQAAGPIVADMTLTQVLYIVAGVIIVITFLGQRVLRH